MVTNILKWLFVNYNGRALKEKYFSGSLSIDGLSSPVTVYRDNWHIPHIYANTNDDLFFAQGFIHAQDRIWQMELNRRIAAGRLSEAFGDVSLDTDRLTRTLGFNRLTDGDLNILNSETLQNLQSFSNGVNAYLNKGKLPVEFLLTRIKPEKWTPNDTLGWGRVMTWTLSHGWSGCLTRSEIVRKVGEAKAEELGIYYPEENPIELPNGIEFNNLTPDKMLESVTGPFLFKDMEGGGRGSNTWVVSGKLTQSGQPILCNDTHLQLQQPSVWYLNHLHSAEGYHVAGVSLPGIPGVMIGHNDHIAWGATLSFTDGEDLFVEKVHPEKPLQYQYKGEWKGMDVIAESIKVKKQKSPHIETVRNSIHGPIISDVVETGKACISYCSISLEENQIVNSFLKLDTAKNWDEFVEAVQLITAPPLNISYADNSGNIGMWVTGKVPIRGKGKGQMPAPGWTGEFDWVGSVPVHEMPHALNPECGYIISTNNKPVDDGYPHYLGNSFMNGYRAKRIEDALFSKSTVTIDDCKKMHTDFYSIPGEKMKEGFRGFRTARPKAQKLLELLLDWDCVLDKESKGGIVYEILLYTMLKNLVNIDLGKELTEKWMGVGEHPVLLPTSELLGHATVSLFNILQNENSHWLKTDKEAIKLMEDSLVDSCEWLEKNLGDDPSGWKWGKLHTVSFNHALGVQKPLDKIFNLGPIEFGGDTDTVCQSAYNPGAPYAATSWCPAFRMIVPMDNFNQTLVMNPAGQSGVYGSEFYDNALDTWLAGDYFRLYWDLTEVEKNQKSKLVIQPK